MSDHESIRELLAVVALGAAEPQEDVLVEAHLAVCPACRAEVEQLRAAATLMARDVPQHDPSPDVRRRLMRVVEQEAATRRRPAVDAPVRSPRRAWLPRRAGLWPVLTGALAAACIGLVAWIAVGTRDDAPSPTRITAAARLPGVAGEARLLDGGESAVVRLTGLPAPASGRGYELWSIDAQGTPVSKGFMAVTPGAAGDVYAVAVDVRGASALAVTRERLGDTAAPSETPIVTLPL